MSKRNPRVLGKWGEYEEGGTRVIASEDQWKMLKGWDSTALAMGERHRVFVASLVDIMEDWHGKILDSKGHVAMNHDPRGDRPMVMNDIRYRFFEEASCRQNLDFLLLTKRPESYDFWLRVQRSDRPNLWVGTTVENQDYIWRAQRVIQECESLRRETGYIYPVRFLSIEPLLGPIDLKDLLGPDKINWIIIGGESGPGARQLHINWVDDLISQGRRAGIAIFLKQLGKQYKIGEGLYVENKDPKGGDITEWAPMYQIREIPYERIANG